MPFFRPHHPATGRNQPTSPSQAFQCTSHDSAKTLSGSYLTEIVKYEVKSAIKNFVVWKSISNFVAQNAKIKKTT
jgi:hypothetical protein